jgi:hypothetical protein
VPSVHRRVAAPDGEGAQDVLTYEEGMRLLDAKARRYLGMTGEKFIRAWYRGEFDANPDRPEVLRVAGLLPFAGPHAA